MVKDWITKSSISAGRLTPEPWFTSHLPTAGVSTCRDCLEELEGTHDLVSLLQSCLGRLPGKGNFHQLSCQDPPGETCKAVPAGACGSYCLKGWEPCVNTSCRVSFLDPDTREVLEAHIKRFWVKHRWTLPLKVLKPINLFKSKKCQPSTVLQFATSPSATCVSGSHSTVKFAEFLEKPPRAHSGEKVIREESVPTLKRPLLVPSTVCKEIQSTLGAVPSIDYHGPSKASLTGQEGRPPSQSLTLSLVGRTWKSESVEWVKRDSLEPGPISATVRNEPREESGGQASRDPCHRVTVMEVNLGSQSLRGEEAREAVEAKESPALQPQSSVILETKVLTKSQTTNVHMRSLEVPGASRSFLLPRLSVFQHPGEPCLNMEVASEFNSKVKVQSDNQLQDFPKHRFLAADNLASQVPQCHPQRVPTRDRSTLKSGTAEGRAGMTAVGQIVEENRAVHHGLHATKLNEHRLEFQVPVCGGFGCHRLTPYPEQGRMMGSTACSHEATSKGQSCPIREREVRHQHSLKSVRFDDEQLGLRCLPSLPPKKSLFPVSTCQYGPRIPGRMVDTAPGGVFLIVEISVPADAPDPDDNRNGPHPPSLSGPSTRGNAVTWGGGGRVSTGLLTPLVSPWSQALPLGPNSQGSLQNGQSSESGARTCGRGRYPEERVDRAGT
ncbi:putative spermatogenesis-associated protein 31C1 [Mesoplodon densirostris]|uniref:putative spermatogenesis-associated protein 31C1 n=1 Tax=Mesoplodon densirostris TaxID=48708 RepID=UPI0028DC0034|nr:putative spermatogenesis-associated protein 31C1 [Mesoplodon densirostris]